MKCLIILFVTILSQNKNVKCDLIEIMEKKIVEISKVVASTFSKFVNKVHHMLDRSATVVESKIEQYVLENRLKHFFDDFVVNTDVAFTEPPEYYNLRSEPTALMSTPQLATFHGKRIESHVIKTKDDYLLTLHRVQKASTTMLMETVLLHHGLMGSSADWIILGPNMSLPYLLSDAGYDVWMTNARGNYYSRGHISQRVNSSDYWRFSFQEMGEYDLPAAIDFIIKIKGKSFIGKIDYIGHSMGATALLVLLSTNPIYNHILQMGILLAPLAFMNNVHGPLQLLTSISNNPLPEQLLNIIGDTEFLPSRKIPKIIVSKFCPEPKIICSNPLLFLAGNILQYNEQDEGFLARLLYQVPAGASTNTIIHYGQLVQSKTFHRFGEPLVEFPLKRVELPIVLISSSDDRLATVPDVMKLYFSIANPIDHYVIRDQNLSHTEFVWGNNANEVVFKKVLEYLGRGLNYTVEKDNEV